MRSVILSVAVVCLMAGVSCGQEFPKPGAEHARLKELVGTWEATMDMQGHKSKCLATYKSICGGMWLQSDFEGDLGGLKFQGHGLDGYDLVKKKYVGTWYDSMASYPMHFEGNYDEKSKLLVMTGDTIGMDGKPEKFKTTTETKDKDHFVFKMYKVTGDKEELSFSIEYKRKK